MSTPENQPFLVQGRIVFVVGDLFKGDLAKVFGTQTPKLNKQGQQYREYGFGLAVPKHLFTPENMAPKKPAYIWTAIHNEAYKVHPNRQIPQNFHMKWKDGDTGTNQDGTPLNTKQGYPGHIVFTFKTTLPIKFYKWEDALQSHVQINEGIQCGDWVEVQANINVHTGVNAGLFLNPNSVQFIQKGEPIVNAPSPSAIFGQQAPSAPSWMPPAAQGGAPQFQQPAAPSFAPPAQQAQVQPHFAVVPQQFQPQVNQTPNGFAPAAAPGFAPQQQHPQNATFAAGPQQGMPTPASSVPQTPGGFPPPYQQ